MSDDVETRRRQGAVMTTMRERGTQRRYLATAIAVVCSLKDDRKFFSWNEPVSESGTGSAP
jgi:hypothetical protein